MVTTLSQLQTARHHHLAYVLVFEGVGLAFTTTSDVAGIAAAWDFTDWQPSVGGVPLTPSCVARLDHDSTGGPTSDEVTGTFTHTAGRPFLVLVHLLEAGASVSSLTCSTPGVTLDFVATQGWGSGVIRAYRAKPGTTSSTATLHLTLSGSIRWAIQVIDLVNADATGTNGDNAIAQVANGFGSSISLPNPPGANSCALVTGQHPTAMSSTEGRTTIAGGLYHEVDYAVTDTGTADQTLSFSAGSAIMGFEIRGGTGQAKGESSHSAKWYTGMFYPGETRQEIEPLNPRLKADSLQFRVLDPYDTLAAMVLGSNRSSARTFLTQDLPSGAARIYAQETSAFPGPGGGGVTYLYLGNEAIRVADADKVSDGWTFCDRGVWALFENNSGSRFQPTHRRNAINGAMPVISSAPRTWYNRPCKIFLHVRDGAGVWNAWDEALCVWTGRVKEITDNGDRSITFDAVHIIDWLQTQIFESQFTARLKPEKFYVTEAMARIRIREFVTASVDTTLDVTLTAFNVYYTASELISAINARLLESVSSSTFAWSLSLDGEGRARVTMTTAYKAVPAAGTQQVFSLHLHPIVWIILGFYDDGPKINIEEISKTFIVTRKELAFVRDQTTGTQIMTWEARAPFRPLQFWAVPETGTKHSQRVLVLENIQGAWAPQPIIFFSQSGSALVEGYIQIGDLAILEGYFVAGVNEFVVLGDLSSYFSHLGFSGGGAQSITQSPGNIRDLDLSRLEVKQIWFEQGQLKNILLRLLLSSGDGTNVNHAIHDVNPYGMGVGLPASLLDADSIHEMSGLDNWNLLLNKPTEFSRILESALAAYGRHMVYKPGGFGGGSSSSGVLSVVEPRADGPTIAVAYQLNENNKAHPADRMKSQQGAGGVINRIEIKYDRALDGGFRGTFIAEDIVSSSDFGQRRAAVIEAWGALARVDGGVEEFAYKLAGKALAYFSRPMTYAERTADKTMITMSPGDTVLLSDPYLVNPKTGVRGVTNQPAWVLGVAPDWSKVTMRVKLAYSAELAVDKICAWAPTARVNHLAANAGYVVVDGSNRYLQTLFYQYSAFPPGVNSVMDIERFAAGDKLRVRELSPVDPFNPLTFAVTVASIDLFFGRIYLTATIAGWDTAKKYIIVPDVITTVQQAQKRDTFLADDVDDSTGALAHDSYIWGVPKAVSTGGTPPTVTQQPVRPPRGYLDQKGYPLAVGDLYELLLSVNGMMQYRTRQCLGTGNWTHAAAVTASTSRELLYLQWVPLMGRGLRPILVSLYARSTLGALATLYITSSKSMPVGLTNTSVAFVDAPLGTVTRTTSSASYAYLTEAQLLVYPEQSGAPPGVWVTIEGQVGSGAVDLRGVSIFEDIA